MGTTHKLKFVSVLFVFVASAALASTIYLPSSGTGTIGFTPISTTGPATVTILNADVERNQANQINVAGHGLVTNDGPYALTSTGTTPFAATGWLYGEALYAIRIDENEFSLSETVDGSAITITSAGDGDHTLTKLTQSDDLAVPGYSGTTGMLLRTYANPCTIATAGTFRCSSVRGSTFFATETHPNPSILNNQNGYNMGNVTGAPGAVTAGHLRLANNGLYPTIIGGIGTGSAVADRVRILHSHTDATRMVSPTTVVVSTPSQDTGTEICALDLLTCVFVEETVAPVDGVPAAWTWQACGDDLTDTNWARAYCSTVTGP